MPTAARPAPCGARLSRLHLALSARGLGAQPALGSPQRAAGGLQRTPVSCGSRRPAGGDAAPAGQPERTVQEMLQQVLNGQQELREGQQELREDLQRGQQQMREELQQMREEQNTLLGNVFDVAAAAVPEERWRRLYNTPVALAADCGLVEDVAAARRCLAETLLAEHAAAHAFRKHVARAVLVEQAKAQEAEQDSLSAVVSSWRSLPQPKSAADWAHEAELLGQVARALKPNSEVQQAVLLLRKYCSAAAREETEGHGPLLQLLESTPPPGALEWPPAMALALAWVGKWARELEFDAALRLIRDEHNIIIIIQETKLRATGISKAMRQLRQAFRLVAWLHSALGAVLPRLEGRIVVPSSELRDAQRKLRGASGTVQDAVPGEAGPKFTVSIKADTV